MPRVATGDGQPLADDWRGRLVRLLEEQRGEAGRTFDGGDHTTDQCCGGNP